MAGSSLRKLGLAVCLLFLLGLVRAQSPPDALPMLAGRSADTYAIYSLLLPGEPFNSMSADQTRRLAIARTTVNIADMNPAIPPNGQLTPPPGNEKAFLEAVQDFQSRRYERIRLTRNFAVDRDYTLLTHEQVAEFRNARAGISPGSDLQEKYAGYPGITFFSEVFFDSTHQAALVYMNNWCTNLCAAGEWIYLEKRGATWVRRSGLNI